MKKIKNIINYFKNIDYYSLSKETIFLSKFFVLVILFLFYDLLKIIYHFIIKIPLIGKNIPLNYPKKIVNKSYDFFSNIFNFKDTGEISSLDIISLAVKNLKTKKHRTTITIGGMAIGFGSVIFLLSIGYGVQNLVVNKVAKLDEMKQIVVTTGQASSLLINDTVISDLTAIKHVESVLPLVSVVSKIEFNNSVSDAVAYGVSKKYLQESAIKPIKGKIFEDSDVKEINAILQSGIVAGIMDEKFSNAKMYKQFSQVEYSIYPLVWKEVHLEPSKNSEIVGYTQRVAGVQNGIEVWGEHYNSESKIPEGTDFFGNDFLLWIKDSFPIWKKEACDIKNPRCFEGEYVILTEGGLQQQLEGYLTEDQTSIKRYNISLDDKPTLKEGEKISNIQFSIPNNQYISIYSEPDEITKKLNLFTQSENSDKLYDGELIFGSSYKDDEGWGSGEKNSNGKQMGYWIRAKLPIWRQLDCNDCEKLFLKEVDDQEQHVLAYTFISANTAIIDQLENPPKFGSVLGDATESAQASSLASESANINETIAITEELNSNEATDSGQVTLEDGTIIYQKQLEDGTIDWVTINSEDGKSQQSIANIISFAQDAQKNVIVNRALISVLGIDENDAIGKKFMISLVLDNDFFEEDFSGTSEPTEMTIIGIIPEEKSPAFYIPFNDLKSLGIMNYTSLKVIVDDQKSLKDVRSEIEAYGFKTNSVVDTVDRINSLFATIKIFLSVLGLVALGVAALGMFNTLTVSLLEKTREVGLMKTIGMKSNEVKRLFLAESIIMGLSGGIFGLMIGAGAGNILSFLLSTISVTRGAGYINLVSIPLFLAVGIVTLSFVIGIVTGLYPAKRATKISALNALRYE